MTIAEAAAQIGFSNDSVYRWRREQEQIEAGRLVLADAQQNWLTKRLYRLWNRDQSNHYQTVMTILEMSIWMAAPTSPQAYMPMASSLIIQYYLKKSNVKRLSDIPKEDLDLITRSISAKAFDFGLRLTTSSFIEPEPTIAPQPYMSKADRYEIGDNFTHRDYLVDLCWYLMTSKIDNNYRKFASLTLGRKALASGALSGRWKISKSSFNEMLRRRGVTMPFLFVEQRHSKLEWRLDPTDVDFADFVDDLIEDHQAIRDFLSKSRWTAEQLELRLHPRAHLQRNLPIFPNCIEPIPVTEIELPATFI
ncbi:hypothetical protein D8780_00095 [Notoacmeibacter ruber]|uniref:Uncharacterized protein n=2 Tax=Notoacmeibacter ruber TaxID=2670375 RepID=A0A3L7J8M2_9HYPH|nr:hypothetical protein D8780_00095 [Notoacmeibacter ruber]